MLGGRKQRQICRTPEVHAAFLHAAELRESFSFGAASTFHLEMQPGSSVFLEGVPRTIEALVRKRKKINS